MKSVPLSILPTMIGKNVHVAGWPPACVFVLDAIEGEIARIHTRVGRKRYSVLANRIQYVRKDEPSEDLHTPR